MSFQPSDLLVVGTLIILEGLLSADNALVLALLVRHLPDEQQKKALLYGLVGAFVLRGIFIALAGFIIKLWWMCGLGAAYLIFLAVKHFVQRRHDDTDGSDGVEKKGLGFWHTVAVVEFTDIVFAIDSILVAVALVNDPKKLWIVYAGGFIGIVLLRLAASLFIQLINKYPSLDNMAYALVGWAGVKLASTAGHLYGEQNHISLPELPKPVFWAVFAIIVGVGIWSAVRNKAPEEEGVEEPGDDDDREEPRAAVGGGTATR